MAAIEATATVRPDEANRLLLDLAESDDEDICHAVDEAIATARLYSGDDGEDSYDEDDEDEEDVEPGRPTR